MKNLTSIDEKDLQYIEHNWKKVPLPILAKKFSMTVLELTSLLRQKGIVTDIQPWDLEYINENIDRIPASEIEKELSLTHNQLSLILYNVLGKKRRKSANEMSLTDATSRTKWLIEEKLHFDVDDFLPRNIQRKHFVDSDLYDCLRFAETEKKKDSIYKNFTAIAFLVCQTYPHKFRPFQFSGSKTNEYFRGPGGRKNLINAARWVIEKKMEHKPELLAEISKNKYFLRSKDLQFFGIGSPWFRIHFSSRDKFVSAILKEYQIVMDKSKSGTTRKLREILTESGRHPGKCEVPGCYFDDEFGVDIHHIVPRSASNQVRIDINCIENLVVLCPNHHRIAEKFDWQNKLNLRNCPTWMGTILRFISEKEEISKQNVEKEVKAQVVKQY